MITLLELKDRLGITTADFDASLQAAIDAAIAYVTRTTGRHWGEIVTVVDEVHDYAPIIFTDYNCVNDVTAVKVEGTTLDTDLYTWSDTGRIRMSHNIRRQTTTYDFDDILVSYTTGVLDVPADLKEATLMLAMMTYELGLSGGRVASREQVGSRSIEYSATDKPAYSVIDSYKGL